MYMAGALSSSAPFAVGDLGSEQGGRRSSYTENVSVDITEVEVSCSKLLAPYRTPGTSVL